MKPRALVRAVVTAALALSVAAPAAARGQRHAPAGSGSQPAAAVPRSSPSPSPSPAPAPAPAPRSSAGRDSGSDRGGQATSRSGGSDNSQDNDRQSSAPGRRRGNLPATGEAVARTSPARPPHGGGGHGGVIVGYPWWYGGAYYGYYAYDPWFGWYPSYDPGPAAAATRDDGALKIKVKPTDATVYVDGYYVGVVDEFDGVFQELKLVAGPHHIEILSPEFETLSFDVLIQPEHTMTYRGELVRSKN